MAKYLGIPLTVSNGNKVPITAQPELVDTTVTQSSDWFAAAASPSTASITSDGGLVSQEGAMFCILILVNESGKAPVHRLLPDVSSNVN